MTTKLYLDKRVAKELAPIKIAINRLGSSAYINTGIRVEPSQWDRKAGKIIGHPLKARLNLSLSEKKLQVDKAIEELRLSGVLHGKTASEIREAVLLYMSPENKKPVLFLDRFKIWEESKHKEATRTTYKETEKKILAFTPNAHKLRFEDIDKAWLEDFDRWLSISAPSANARSIHMRNIRAVFNEAIDEGITQCYPFRRFKIASEPTRDRSLRVEEIRRLAAIECSNPSQEEARDIFLLLVMLCGINIGDLASVGKLNNGRIEILRAKTGQPLSIAIPDEAATIIAKYKGENHLVNILERYGDYRVYAHRINDNLKKLGMEFNPHTKKWEGERIKEGLSLYCARYSFATIAAELDIPERTIGAALGHSTAGSVTNIYMRTDMRRKVDTAQRAVIDYIFA